MNLGKMFARQVLVFSIVILGLHSTYAALLERVRPSLANGPFAIVNHLLARGTGKEDSDANIAVARHVLRESEKLGGNVEALLEVLTMFGDFRRNEAICDEANVKKISKIGSYVRFVLKNVGSNKTDFRQSEGRVQRLINQLYAESFKACVKSLSARLTLKTPQAHPDFYTAIELTRNFRQFALNKDAIGLLAMHTDFIQRSFDIMAEIYRDTQTGLTWLNVLLNSLDSYGRQKLHNECKDSTGQEKNKCVAEHLLDFLSEHSCSLLKEDSRMHKSLSLIRSLSKSIDLDLLEGNSAAEIKELRRLAELVVGYDICISAIRIDPETLVNRVQKLSERHSMDLTV